MWAHKNCQKLNIYYTYQLRLQSTAAAITNENTLQHPEWKNAKPYEDIPTLGTFTSLRNFFPGGKYYKLNPSKLMMALKRDMGEICRFNGILGKGDTVVTHNVDNFVTVLRNEGIWPTRPGFEALSYHRSVHRAEFFKGIEGIIATQGEKWANFRTVVNPVLVQPKNVRLYMHKMSQINKEFIEKIREIRDPKTLEVPASFEREISRWTLESISVMALDKQLGLINKNRNDPLAMKLFQAVNDLFLYGMEVEYKPPIWKYYKTKSFKNLMKSCDTILETTNAYVSEAIERLEEDHRNGVPEKPEHEKSVLEKLIKIDKKIANVMAMDLLLGGVDTTAATFAGILLCLAKNPDKQAILREEVIKILPHKDSEFNEDSLRNLPYLRSCIKESLRMYPIIIGSSRKPVNDIVLSGYKIPKGTRVAMISVSLLQNDFHFPRAKEYLPERWLRTENQNTSSTSAKECPQSLKPSSPFVYLPFGFGPRSCIGRRIVEMELELGIARIIRNFHVEFNHSTENAFKYLLVSVPNIPLTFKFTDTEN